MLAAGAAMAVSGTIEASSAPIGNPATTVAPADNGITLVKRRHHGGGKHYRGHRRGHRHRGHSGIWWGAPLLAAPFLYNGYGYGDDNYGYYGSGYGGGNSCYRACRYEHGPRYCRNNWEDYC